jgi:hypothetical protein
MNYENMQCRYRSLSSVQFRNILVYVCEYTEDIKNAIELDLPTLAIPMYMDNIREWCVVDDLARTHRVIGKKRINKMNYHIYDVRY